MAEQVGQDPPGPITTVSSSGEMRQYKKVARAVKGFLSEIFLEFRDPFSRDRSNMP